MESSISEINTRIARLAIALGVSLQNDHEVTQVIQRPRPLAQAVERRSGMDRRAGDRASSSPDRRLAYQWEELRGLLVLRYGVERRYVNEVGVTATQHIMIEAEQRLARDGFKPGADGVDLQRLFD